MSEQRQAPNGSAFDVLRQFARRPLPVERCELCSAALAKQHQHLLEPATRKLVCACDACAILFPGEGGAKYKRVPRSIHSLPDFRLTDGQWDGLMMPINMAFFFASTPHGRVVAMYPSPAGATESLLSLDTWGDIVQENPPLQQMEADVEALLVNRIGHARGFSSPEYYLAPIDQCYRLVGVIRTHWRGLSGGTEVWREIAQFFEELKARATPRSEHVHA
jgi:Family of unknown function (DUF5947)